MSGQVFGELSRAHKMGDMLTGIEIGINAKMFFGYRIAPFDAVYLIHDYHTFRHGRRGALQTFQCEIDLLITLALVTHETRQACKYVSPLAGPVRQSGLFALEPFVQYG